MVRFEHVVRPNYIAIEEFHLFIPLNQSYLYATVNTHVCNELLKRVKASRNLVSYSTHEVDLAGIKTLFLSEVRGGWFKYLKIADVSAAAIFGSNVGDSDDWLRYENSGEISALMVEFKDDGVKHSVQITRTGTIVLFENFSESYALDFLERVNDVV